MSLPMNIQSASQGKDVDSEESVRISEQPRHFGSKPGPNEGHEQVASSVFEDGNFSAKYISQDTKQELSSLISQEVPETNVSNPVTITGGFRELHPVTTPLGSVGPRNRRPSMLSNLMASTYTDKPRSSGRGSASPMLQAVEIVERHLNHSPVRDANSPADTRFDSLKRQGGDITRDIYNWVSDHKVSGTPLRKVASSGSLQSTGTSSELRMPGAFRRDFIAHRASDAEVETPADVDLVSHHSRRRARRPKANFMTRNFIEFLSLYGHFAGENLEEETGDEQELEQSDVSDISDASDFEEGDEAVDEADLLLSSSISPGPTFRSDRRARSSHISVGDPNRTRTRRGIATKPRVRSYSPHKTSNRKAFLLLLKAFVGTGVVFLPKSFSNGGLLFCNLMIMAFSVISYYCFMTLIWCTERSRVSGYGDLGLKLFGPKLQFLILLSLALSQLGFSSSYVVFVAENFSVVVNTFFSSDYGVGLFVVVQLFIFLPLSLTRNISKLSLIALIADAFILLGLVYIYSCSGAHLLINGVSPKVSLFQPNTWTLFMGTAVFAYEGIGLLIPIKESMKHPEQFQKLLILVMVVVTVIFVTLSTISYLSYGDDVKMVILMNFPQTNFALIIQICYALAILLSTPLQLFPAIKIFESYLFHRDRATWRNKIRKDSENKMRSETQQLFSGVPIYDSTSRDLRQLIQSMPEDAVDDQGVMSGKRDSIIKWLKNAMRVLVVLAMCAIAYLGSSDLDRFVSLIGSFTCIPLIYIYPPLLYVSSFEELRWSSKLVNGLVLIIGMAMMVYTSYQTISSWGK
ncbi:hypothetical protein KL937_001996 [Ogataea polymorpha]|nr:hypothetical protein KL937_001996 [Ogataea polymorpha]KAG7935866.1 hypothetical protein KL904_002514 [Ogataea polymorpha]